MMAVKGDSDLAKIVLARGLPGHLAGRLHCRQRQHHQEGHNAQDDENLDQGQSRSSLNYGI